MTNISLNLSNKLPARITDSIQSIKSVTDDLDIPILLVGATARDLILQYAYNIKPNRATKDIDFGVAVSSWDEFEKLKSAINERTNFTSNALHRLINTETTIDLIPFGEIESPRGKIVWENKNEMTTSGFTEAFESALDVKLAEDLTIKVISPIGLALLKLVAWTDRKSDKDSQDFWLIVKNYLDLGNEERLYDEMLEFVLNEYFDRTETGARLLGRDLAKILKPQTESIISSIFYDETKLRKFAAQIYRTEASFEDDKFDEILTVLEAFQKGLKD